MAEYESDLFDDQHTAKLQVGDRVVYWSNDIVQPIPMGAGYGDERDTPKRWALIVEIHDNPVRTLSLQPLEGPGEAASPEEAKPIGPVIERVPRICRDGAVIGPKGGIIRHHTWCQVPGLERLPPDDSKMMGGSPT